jgi:hypothetical protein
MMRPAMEAHDEEPRTGEDAEDADAAGPSDEAPWHRVERWVATVLGVVAVLHGLAVVGQHAFVYTDSIDYETLDFTGSARRPWVTPLLYWVTDDQALRIVLQAAISVVCWSLLALQASALARTRVARWAILLAVLGLSLTTTVTSWDTAMLSESLALSLTALLLTALLRFTQDPSHRSAALALAAWLLWLFTRQNHLVLGGLVTVAVAVVLAMRWRRTRVVHAPSLLLLGGMAVLSAVAVVSYAQNTEIVHYNLAQIIGNRVFPDEDRSAWFTDEGMPVPRAHPLGLAVTPQALLEDGTFRDWVEEDGVGVYARYLLQHPWYSVTGPLDSLLSDRPPFGDRERADEVMLASPDSYGVGREVLPGPVEDLLFEPGQAGVVVFGLVVAITLTALRWRRVGPDARWLVPLVALGLQWPALTAVWHASTAELGRLALPSALVVRLALFLQLGLLLDAWWSERTAA